MCYKMYVEIHIVYPFVTFCKLFTLNTFTYWYWL